MPMAKPFYSLIDLALANPGLQEALDANAERRMAARVASYASLPEEIQVLRRRAHDLRHETIANLDTYLEAFTARARQNGLVVHYAADAAEAVKIVLEIARQSGARRVAKAKTMVGEEIEINHALQAAGLEVVETDLGEYIVQLRGERPAHIITPAVHLRRADVGRLFEQKLGIPYTEDVVALTAAARQALRRVFLEADLGISGVNFGVVESGTLCMLTNEGNGRMVTTLPRVHVALMGIERLVPALDDLALMLSLLPRSASGLKLTVYTNLINRPGEGGSGERHLVLVDNGRRRLRSSSLAEALLCIRCGACLNACPVFREIGGHAYVGAHGEPTPYPGPIGSVVSPGMFGLETFGQLARASSLCGACQEACPVDIPLPELLLRVRAGAGTPADGVGTPADGVRTPVDGVGTPGYGVGTGPDAPANIPAGLAWGLKLYAWAAGSARRFTFAQRLAALAGRLASPRAAWMRLPAFTGWGRSRDFPRPAARPFRARWGELAASPEPPFPQAQRADQPQPGRRAPAPDETAPQAGLAQPEVQDGDLPARFQAALRAAGGNFHACREEDLAQALLGFLRERSIDSLLAWEAQALPAGLLAALQAGGIAIEHSYSAQEELARGLAPRAGLTGAAAGVAETGSLLAPAGPGRPPAASLVPEIHLAVLSARDLVPQVRDALALPVVREAPALALITGPSRTADIEMTLTIGVHGPGEVHVFLCDQGGAA